MGPGNQTQKEFSLSEKQGGRWLEGCKGRILGQQRGEWGWVGQVLEGHCWKFGFCSKYGGTPGTSEPLGVRGSGKQPETSGPGDNPWGLSRGQVSEEGGMAEQGPNLTALCHHS